MAAAVPLLLVLIASKLRIAPAVRATVVPGLALLLFLGEWILFAVQSAEDGSFEIGLAALVLFPFFVAALFLVLERVTLLWQRWRRRKRPHRDALAGLQALRTDVADKGWASL